MGYGKNYIGAMMFIKEGNLKMKIKDCVLIEAFKCNENDKIVEVSKKLREINLRHIFVVANNKTPVGIISVIDINNRVVAEGKDSNSVLAKDIMTKPIEVHDIEDSVEEVYKNMISKNHVMDPVTKDSKMIGIITIHQLIKHLDKNE